MLKCNPFENVKDESCLQRLLLLRTDMLVGMYSNMLSFYQNMAPMQKKMMKFMDNEIDELDQTDSWKRGYDEDEDDENAGQEGW